MNRTMPITLNLPTGNERVNVYLFGSLKELATVPLESTLIERLTQRVSDEEFLYSVPSESGVTIIAKPKTETELSYRLQSARALGAKIKNLLTTEQVETAAFRCGKLPKEESLAVVEGSVLAAYQFLTYKTEENSKPNKLRSLAVEAKDVLQSDLDELYSVASATFAARDFVNEPVITLTATEWSRRITELGKSTGFSTTVLNKKQIEELKMGGLLGVNRGSVEPPTFNILEYRHPKAKNTKPVVLVGKGVVYDTGGYNIKTAQMAKMKSDMGGGAAVCGAMAAMAANKLPVHVIGLIPATDNRIDGKAIVADDVLTMMSGTTVEVLNTDAEGRLILADALHYAKRYEPELVIDLATLTGAAARVTGHFGIAMCADKADTDAIKQSGERVYERLMEFPMWREYHEAIRSNVADIKNIGGPVGGNITAATFLNRFTDYPWIHLDIAGPSFLDTDTDYRPAGATGVGVRLLYDFIKHTYC